MIKNIQLISGYLVMMICAVLLAQTTGWSALKVSPTQQNLQISPGNTETIQLQLSNSSRTDKLHLLLYVTDYNIRQDGSPTFPNANATKDSLASWVKIKETDVVLKPGERRIVPIKYTVPRNAKGERYGAIMVEKSPVKRRATPEEERSNKLSGIISVSYRIACTVLLSVDGTKFVKKGSVTNVAVNIPAQDLWVEKQKIEVKAIFKNDGNIHISPRRGEALIVHKKLRKVVARIPLTTPRNPNVFPGASRDYKGYIEEPLRPGEYAVQAKFNVGGGAISRVNTEFLITQELSEVMNQMYHGDSEYYGPTIIASDPQLVEVNIPVGGYRSSSVTVNNQNEEPIQVQSYIKDLKFQPDGEMQIMDSGTAERSCADWVSIQPAKFQLAPGASKKIILRVRIPDGADGGHYGKLVFETSPLSAKAKTPSPSELETSLGSTLMVIVPGTTKIKGAITTFESSLIGNGKPPEFKISFNNTGNVHTRPTGVIRIKDYMGDVVHEQSLGKNVPFVLPGNTRQIKEIYNGKELPAGKYSAIVVINSGDEADVQADCEFTIADNPAITNKPIQVAGDQKKVINS